MLVVAHGAEVGSRVIWKGPWVVMTSSTTGLVPPSGSGGVPTSPRFGFAGSAGRYEQPTGWVVVSDGVGSVRSVTRGAWSP